MQNFTKTFQTIRYNSYDLNYKLKLKSSYNRPHINKIVIRLNPQSLLSTLTTDENLKQRILLKCWIIIYYLNFMIPNINSFYLKDSDHQNSKQPTSFYSFAISKSNRMDVLQLLIFLLVEHDALDLGISNKAFANKNEIKKGQLNCQVLLDLRRLSSLNELLEQLFNKVELQALKLELNFVIFTGYNINLKYKTIKNIFPLWNL